HAGFRARERRHGVPRVIDERWADLVCVAAEANAWPYPAGRRHRDAQIRDKMRAQTRDQTSKSRPADELVHWVAHRPATGETLSVIVAPQDEIAPGTVGHTGLDLALLRSGVSLAELHRRWDAFLRPDDLIASWGHYEPELFASAGGKLPDPDRTRLDLRHVARA